MSGIETGKTYHHQAWCKMLTRAWTAVECNCGAMTDKTSADHAAAKAHAVTDRLLIHGDNKIEAAAFILALQQENAELRTQEHALRLQLSANVTRILDLERENAELRRVPEKVIPFIDRTDIAEIARTAINSTGRQEEAEKS